MVAGIFWFVSGCAWLALLLLWRRATGTGEPLKLDRVGPKPWTLSHVLLLVALLFLLIGMASALAHGLTVKGVHVRHLEVIASSVFSVAGLAVVLGFVQGFGWSFTESFGLRQISPWAALGLAICFLAAVWPWLQTLARFWEFVLEGWGLEAKPQEVVEMVRTQTSPAVLALLGALAVLVAPLFEELVFRGLAYPALKQKCGAPAAALLVSALFALLHQNAAAWAPLMALGLTLVVTYEASGSLWTPMFLHSVFNAANLAGLLLRPEGT